MQKTCNNFSLRGSKITGDCDHTSRTPTNTSYRQKYVNLTCWGGSDTQKKINMSIRAQKSQVTVTTLVASSGLTACEKEITCTQKMQ